MENLNVNTKINYANVLGSTMKILMLLPEYYNQWFDPIEDYLNGIDKHLCHSIQEGSCHGLLIQAVGSVGVAEDIIAQRNKKKVNDQHCLRELHEAFPPRVYNYIRGSKTTT